MKPKKSDLVWLDQTQPDLIYDPDSDRIIGELSFCACFDESIGKLRIEEFGRDEKIRTHRNFISGVFELHIELNTETAPWARWPKVREVGGRKREIAERFGIEPENLHFYSESDLCCLGISYAADPTLTVQRFVRDLVIPFFYRLSFVQQFGLDAARDQLWDEYSHGNRGLEEYDAAMLKIADQKLQVNDRCPCASGLKFKRCCKRELDAWFRRGRLLSTV